LIAGDFEVVFFEEDTAEDMGGGMVAHEKVTSIPVEGAVDSVSGLEAGCVDFVADSPFEFSSVSDFEFFVVCGGDSTGVPFNAAAFRVESGFVQYDEFFLGY